jgi:hypothetical protein
MARGIARSDRPISVRDWRRRPLRRIARPREREFQWIWVYCTRWGCGHKAVMATAPLIIRWGPDDWREMTRPTLRCSACGHRGVTLQLPSWGGAGWMAMPVEHLASAAPRDRP